MHRGVGVQDHDPNSFQIRFHFVSSLQQGSWKLYTDKINPTKGWLRDQGKDKKEF